MKRAAIFEADDGRTFSTAAECREHEARASFALLVNLTESSVRDALDRKNIPLADAIERAGNIIGSKRRESGELKRAAKTTGSLVAAKKLKNEANKPKGVPTW